MTHPKVGFLHFIRTMLQTNVPWASLRYYRAWQSSLAPGRGSISDGWPWTTFEASEFLAQKVTSKSRVFVYGGFGASAFFLDKAQEVITVEHDEVRFQMLQAQITRHPRQCYWHGLLIKPQLAYSSTEPNPSNPDQYSSADMLCKGMQFQQYVSAIDQHPNGYFDIVFIDGRARPSCIVHALPKLAIRGWLVLDNSDRTHYFSNLPKHFYETLKPVVNCTGPTPYMPSFGRTTIWQKTN